MDADLDLLCITVMARPTISCQRAGITGGGSYPTRRW
jgi:hypothetical protein